MDSEKRDKDVTTLPYVVFESVQARNERHLKRMWVLILVLIVLLVGSNIAWLSFMFGMDFETYDYEQGDGINIIGDENKEVTYYGSAGSGEEDNTQERSAGQDQARSCA